MAPNFVQVISNGKLIRRVQWDGHRARIRRTRIASSMIVSRMLAGTLVASEGFLGARENFQVHYS
jgi:hypothetical protein